MAANLIPKQPRTPAQTTGLLHVISDQLMGLLRGLDPIEWERSIVAR